MHSFTLPYIRRQCTPIRCLILGDDALLYIAYVMLIPDTRWSRSQPPADSNDCCLQLHLVVGMSGAQISKTGLVLSASSP